MQSIQEQQNEAFYHFTLSNMVDLIRQYGYSNVIDDLDTMVADELNLKVKKLHEILSL